MAADGEKKSLDLSQAIERGTQRTTLRDLEKKGVQNVKVLDEKALQDLVSRAVDRVVNTQSSEQREKVLADSRRELDRLMKEHKAARSRESLLESDKNELIEQVESLQKELSLQAELEEENLHKKFLEGTASMQAQVEELRSQLKAERERLDRELAHERSRVRETDQARRDAVAQVLALQHAAEAAGTDLQNLRAEVVRQRSEIARLKEAGGDAEAERKAREAADHAKWMLESRLADLQRQADTLEGDGKAVRAEARKAATEADRLRAQAIRLEKELAEEQARVQQLRGEMERAAQATEVEAAVLKERVLEVGHLKAKVVEEHDRAEALREVERSLRAELDRAVKAVADASALEAVALQARAADAERLMRAEKLLAEEQARAAALKDVERALQAELARAAEERERALRSLEEARAEADRLGARAAGLEAQLAALRAEAETARQAAAGAQAAVEAARRADSERSRLLRELDGLRQELAAAQARLADREKEVESRRETAVVVAAEIQQIEESRHQEERELEHLRAEVAGLRAQEELWRTEAAASRSDIRSLYEIVAREQGLARTAQDEAVGLHAKALEILGRSGGVEKELAALQATAKADPSGELRAQVARLQDELAQAKKSLAVKAAGPDPARLQDELVQVKKALAAKTAAANLAPGLRVQVERLQAALAQARKPDPRVAALEAELGRARKARELAAKETAARLKALAAKRPAPAATRRMSKKLAELQSALLRAKKKPASPGIGSGVGLDGRGLLEDFLRRIQLKELFQKHVPVKDRGGRTHPSETLLEVVEAAAAGPRASKGVAGTRLEVFGAPGKPALDELKAFQAGLAPQAVRRIERVHDGLRHQLVPLPPKGERLVLDLDMPSIEIGKKGRLGAYRPLVCFDGARGEFWKARLRSAKGDEGDGVLPFLRDCLAKVPRGFARARLLLRLDPRFATEPVVRFLDRSGAGYVMAAPDSKELRAAARKAPLRELSGGWSVGEFERRLHPIRATKGRYVVLKRRASKPGPAPTFSDGTHAYHVLLADRKSGPWRAWTALEGRAASLEAERGLLAGYADSPLLGRGRRARSAAFTNHLLASDLLQWFKRAGLPPAEQGRSQESLRKDVLLLSPPEAKRRESTVLVLPRKDGRRRLYRTVAERLGRLRTSAPFKLGR